MALTLTARRAELFADLLDGRAPQREAEEPEMHSLLRLARSLEALPRASAPHRRDARAAVVAAAAAVRAPVPAQRSAGLADVVALVPRQRATPQPTGSPRPVRALPGTTSGRGGAGVLGLAAAVTAVLAAGVGLGASQSLPGEPLYAAKRLAERATLVLPGDPTERAGRRLHLADARLGELRVLAGVDQPGRVGPGPATLPRMADLMSDWSAAAGPATEALLVAARDGDAAAAATLAGFVSGTTIALAPLAADLPPALTTPAGRVLGILDAASSGLAALDG